MQFGEVQQGLVWAKKPKTEPLGLSFGNLPHNGIAIASTGW